MKPPPGGSDGPCDAPGITPAPRVAEEWIDYNGHVNVAYRTLAFDTAVDGHLEELIGIEPSCVARARRHRRSVPRPASLLPSIKLGTFKDQMFRIRTRIGPGQIPSAGRSSWS